MGLLWPWFLVLLGILPLLALAYLWILRRRRRFAVRYSSLALVREALPRQSRLRRHLPFALFLLALACLILALGRPVATVAVPVGQATIVLAMDVSLSMCSTDIPPNRLEAAKDAALSFVQRRSTNTQIGVVAFAGFAELIQTPTTDQELLEDAVEELIVARRTAIGSAILESLDAIAEINKDVAPVGNDAASASGAVPGADPSAALSEGEYQPDIIVLLTDGASNTGPFPLDAAREAAGRGIRVYTIGFGTESGSIMDCGNYLFGGFSGQPQFGGSPFGFGGFGGGFRRGIDEGTLQEIADLTGGDYYSASSASELQEVFENLPTYLITRLETTEISVLFTAIGALLAAIAISLSLLWNRIL
jgi:Ca-activated chloride channel family protein